MFSIDNIQTELHCLKSHLLCLYSMNNMKEQVNNCACVWYIKQDKKQENSSNEIEKFRGNGCVLWRKGGEEGVALVTWNTGQRVGSNSGWNRCSTRSSSRPWSDEASFLGTTTWRGQSKTECAGRSTSPWTLTVVLCCPRRPEKS